MCNSLQLVGYEQKGRPKKRADRPLLAHLWRFFCKSPLQMILFQERLKAGLPACLPRFGLPGFTQWHAMKRGCYQTYGGGSAPDFHGNSLLSSRRFQCLENLKRLAPCQ